MVSKFESEVLTTIHWPTDVMVKPNSLKVMEIEGKNKTNNRKKSLAAT